MTVASLDRELLAQEIVPADPIEIRPITPRRVGGPPALRVGFAIDLDFPVFPDKNIKKIRLTSRTTESLDILNGTDGKVRCTNTGKSLGKICFIFDPDEPNFIPPTRIIPGPRGPQSGAPLSDGGTVRITKSPFLIKAEGFHPGDAFIDASTATSANMLAIEVRASKIPSDGRFQPPTKTRPGSKLISALDSEPSVKGTRNDNGGRPVNPKGSGRKINLFGSQETPGFEDYTSDLHFSGYAIGKFQIVSDADTIFRPWTEDTDPATRIESGTVSDICMRDSPAFPETIAIIRRIAKSGCRLTFASSLEGAKQFIPILTKEFGPPLPGESFPDAAVFELP